MEDMDKDRFSIEDGDCSDDNVDINLESNDIFWDQVDQKCDGLDGVDKDGNGYASKEGGGTDCDDEDPDHFPVMIEQGDD